MPETITDDQLIADYKGLHAAIYAMDCYSCGDLIRLQWDEKELARRGYTIAEGYAPPVVTKEPAEDEE
jgi:hypothetical protein